MLSILVIDDKPEERQKGEDAVRNAAAEAHRLVSVQGNDLAHDGFVDLGLAMEDIRSGLVDGVITDLYFLAEFAGQHPLRDFIKETYSKETPPTGLLIVLEAIAKGIPVVVCTDSGTEGHTAKELMWIVDLYWRQGGSKLFRMNWCKDWEAAAKELLEKLKDVKGSAI